MAGSARLQELLPMNPSLPPSAFRAAALLLLAAGCSAGAEPVGEVDTAF
jgi:hypothetical protein